MSSGTLAWQLGGTTSQSGNSVPATLSGEPPGGYTIYYTSGGPTGAPPTTITPPASQLLTAGGTITWTFNFRSGVCGPAGGRIGVDCTPPPTCYTLTVARNDPNGGALPTASPANSSGCGVGQYVAGENIQLTAYPASGWSIGGWNGTQNDASTSTTNSLVMPATAAYVNVNYIYSPPVGGVRVDGTLDGQPWSGPVNFHFQGPMQFSGYWLTSLYQGVPAGYYAMYWDGGTPPGANITGITPSSYQYLPPNGGIAFTFNFSTPAGYPVDVATGTADSITQTSAVLHGVANPNGAATNAFFWYGIFPYLDSRSPSVALGSSKTDQPYAAQVSGLTCGTQYYFSADAANALGESTGAAVPFTTANCSPASSAFYTLSPCRLVDTRIPGEGPAISSGEGRVMTIGGTCGIPATATAVSLNLTVVNPGGAGYLALTPQLGAPSDIATINFRAGQVRANNTVMSLNQGLMLVFCYIPSGGSVDYILDVNGYFQ
ncbi:MAG TPA: hypothetical protein VHQ90_10995 [Thermoanaerobaculia bacterium]|nr:hypothetical protein [Thermoanaerobaculia bacterium]